MQAVMPHLAKGVEPRVEVLAVVIVRSIMWPQLADSSALDMPRKPACIGGALIKAMNI